MTYNTYDIMGLTKRNPAWVKYTSTSDLAFADRYMREAKKTGSYTSVKLIKVVYTVVKEESCE